MLIFTLLANLAIELFFAAFYAATRNGIANYNFNNQLSSTFFLSVQTFSTVGYGVMVPVSSEANSVVIVQVLCGLFFSAIFSGAIFSKFAKQSMAIVFSDIACVDTSKNFPEIIIRLAHIEHRLLLNMNIHLSVVILNETIDANGESKINGGNSIKLLEKTITFFGPALEIRYKIDTSSKLWPIFEPHSALSFRPIESFPHTIGIFQMTIEGIDSVLKTPFVAFKSYFPKKSFRFHHRFVDMVKFRDVSLGGHIVYVDKINDTRPIAKNSSCTSYRKSRQSMHSASFLEEENEEDYEDEEEVVDSEINAQI